MELDDEDENDLIEDEQSAACLPKSAETKKAKYADNVYCDIRYNLLLKDIAEGITPYGSNK